VTKTTYIIHPHSNMPQMQPAPASLQEMMGQDFSLELRRLVSCSCHEVKHETARPCIRNQKRSQTISYKSTKFATLLMKVMQTYANSKQQRISWASGHTLHHLPRRALKSGQIDTGSPGLQQHPAAKGQEHLPLQKLMDCRWLITG
jgi:hypothetical protein